MNFKQLKKTCCKNSFINADICALIYTPVLIAFILLCLTSKAFSQEENSSSTAISTPPTDTTASSPKTEAKKDIAVFNLLPSNDPPAETIIFTSKLRNAIEKDATVSIVDGAQTYKIFLMIDDKYPDATGKQLYQMSGKELGVQKIIYGSVKVNEAVLDSQQVSKYVVQQTKRKDYEITITIMDAETGKIEATFIEKPMGDDEYNESVYSLAKKINRQCNKTIVRPEPVPTAEEIARKKKERIITNHAISVYGAYGLPLFNLKKMAGYTYGGSLRYDHYFSKTGILRLSIPLEFYIYQPAMVNIDYMRQLSISVNIGSTAFRKGYVSWTPLFIGGGISFYQVNGDNRKTYTNEYYYKVKYYKAGFVQLGTEYSINISNHFSIGLLPSYTISFEKHYRGHHPGIQAGIKIKF